jgi:hypothetical protein
MTFTEFKNSFEQNILPNKPEFIREGQVLINYLGDIWFEEYKRISSVHYYNIYDEETSVDCFYQNKLIPNTWKHLEKVWINYPN